MAKAFLFNNGFVKNHASLSFSFSRGYATVDENGDAVSSTTARYVRAPRLLCGVPEVTNITPNGTNDINYVAGEGVSHDGTTPMMVREFTASRWRFTRARLTRSRRPAALAWSRRGRTASLHSGAACPCSRSSAC